MNRIVLLSHLNSIFKTFYNKTKEERENSEKALYDKIKEEVSTNEEISNIYDETIAAV